MRTKDAFLLGAAVFGAVLFPGIVNAQSLEQLLETETGIPLVPGQDHSLVGHIASCTVVVQDQHTDGIKVFSFDGANSLDNNMGLSAHDITALKVELGNPNMTTNELMDKLEHTKKEVVIKVLESLKSSCALTS